MFSVLLDINAPVEMLGDTVTEDLPDALPRWLCTSIFPSLGASLPVPCQHLALSFSLLIHTEMSAKCWLMV